MEQDPNNPQSPGTNPAFGNQPPERKPQSPALALILAFLPSAMLLSILPFLNGRIPVALFILCSAISVTCCFTASFLLFRRGTGLAVIGGIIFLLLNGLVSLLFGCGAILTGATTH